MWKILIVFLSFFSLTLPVTFAADVNDMVNVRNIDIGTTGNYNAELNDFIGPIQSFFFTPSLTGGE